MRRIRKHGKTTEKKTDRILAGGRIPDGEIRVCDVEKYYGSDTNITKAVDRVSFCVQKGEFVGIMGASGSGKTTLLNMLSTIVDVAMRLNPATKMCPGKTKLPL